MITYLKGGATCPQSAGPKLIAHICNDLGKWGKGFVLALSKRWSMPEYSYREWHNRGDDFALGAVQIIEVGRALWVANMIAQHGVRSGSHGPPIRYDALRKCLGRVGEEATERSASIHMPRIGAGLAGGSWNRIEPLLTEELCAREVSVVVYDW
jgi:O-acetyl-ADP-ribose deacetylase (regulator of RNase III)